MKIVIAKHNPGWAVTAENLKQELFKLIGFSGPRIEHIGSTSVPGLSAKPIIDLLIGLPSERELDEVIPPLIESEYIYYPCYNQDMPYRRLFVKHRSGFDQSSVPTIIHSKEMAPSTTEEHNQRLAHIHVVKHNSYHWIRHIAFRNYLKAHPLALQQYQQLKDRLSFLEWTDGNDYNSAKNDFITLHQRKAISWFRSK